MKHFTKRFAVLLAVVAMIFVAIPALAVPGTFDFLDENPVPTGTTLEALLESDITFQVTEPTDATSVTWYVWAGTTPGTTGDALTSVPFSVVTPEVGDPYYEGTVLASTVNGLDNGTYAWDIIAVDANDNDTTTSITGGPFTFTASFPDPPRIQPADGVTIDSAPWPQFTFADNGADWYQIWIGHGEDAAVPYGYQGLFKWYQADDDSQEGVQGDGICNLEGVCTIPAEDLINVYAGGNEVYEWWMTDYFSGESAADIEAGWNVTTFDVSYPEPATVITNPVPGDGQTVANPPAAITWDADAGTLWYQVWLGRADYIGDPLAFDWFPASEICAEGTCSVEVNSSDFEDMTAYELWVEFWGPNGYTMFTGFDNAPDAPVSFTYDSTFAPTRPIR